MTQNPFDEDIDRRQVPALKTHKMVLGADGTNLFAAGVADMDFKVSPAILKAMQTRHNWLIEQPHILRAPNILNSLAIAASMFTDASAGIIVQPPVFFDFFDILRENNRQIISNPLILKMAATRWIFANWAYPMTI